ncbi:hypothetical protein O0I10_010323 [Lichtheimia ornata]|uniref:Glycosyltransferase 61 catalytic domain-containing protein n=1 Tax=Lichtheimia ornata TaxID=688661 RepID=A0AAD7UWJ3_9FUNG|nr:uncharacterized protein O0I10_010323 [Lichtheimia ornata]KAJ8653987.1 hypothetical protein O0I10_010323 [Lichtheimia ornata]
MLYRRRTIQAFLYACVVCTIFSILYYSYQAWHYTYGTKGPASTWECIGNGRDRQCVVKNFCVDKETGGFAIASSYAHRRRLRSDLSVNLINADPDTDFYYEPKAKWQHDVADIAFKNETLFVYGLYTPMHFSHMLFNGLIPLYRNIRKHVDDTSNVWTYRAHVAESASFIGSPLMTTDFFTTGRDLVRDEHELTSPQQMLLPEEPICFQEAVIGTRVSCSLSLYCEQPIESDIYAAFREATLNYYVKEDHWKQHNKESSLHGTDRDDQACVETMREFKTAVTSNKPTRVIGVINRGGSRHITNLQQVMDAIIDSATERNYVLRVLDFDKGCSLASTAYVMKDVDLLLTPHGSQQGGAVFMKNNSVVISINARGYSENWFAFPLTAMGRRFYNFECQSSICVDKDLERAQRTLAMYEIPIPPENVLDDCLAWENDRSPDGCLGAYFDKMHIEHNSDQLQFAIGQYHKDAPRKIDVTRFMAFFEKTIKEMDDFETMSYRQICDLEKCCGYSCDDVLGPVVYGSALEGRLLAWPQDGIGSLHHSWQE